MNRTGSALKDGLLVASLAAAVAVSTVGAFAHDGMAYTQAVRIEPKFAAAWNNLGHTYRKAQQYGMALDAYQQAISLSPDDPNPHEYMARTHLAMGNKDGAMREYEIVRRLDAKIAGELLRAIQANNSDLGDHE